MSEDLSRYPRRTMFAIVPVTRVEAAKASLVDAGLGDQLRHMDVDDAENFRSGAAGGGLGRRLYNLANHDDLEKGRRYTELRSDEAILRLRPIGVDDARRAAAVLVPHGGTYMHWFGELTVEQL